MNPSNVLGAAAADAADATVGFQGNDRLLLGIILGVTAAARQNSLTDHGLMAVALLGISIPPFVLGPILVLIFSLKLGWLPPARFSGFSSMILPAATLGMIYMGVIARLARSGLLETLRQDYVRTARAKGLRERVVIGKHTLRNAMLPVTTNVALEIPFLVTGAVVTEAIFAWPGVGRLFIASVGDRDYYVLMGLIMISSFAILFANLLADVVYALIDPRIRYD